jgi:hypothetical protein
MADGVASKSSGIDQTAAGKGATGLVPDDLFVSSHDRGVLRALAEQVAAIAARTSMAECRELWAAHNMLGSTRPLVFCDPENGWNEVITSDQLASQGKLARGWEMGLRKEIFWGDRMGDDKPVEPFFDVPYTVGPDDWGLGAIFYQTQATGSYVWDAPIRDYDSDLPRLHSPPVEIDWGTTNGCLAIANDVLGDLLSVRLKGSWWWSLGLTWTAATLRGLQNILLDFIDQPDGLKELLAIISRGHLDKLRFLEANGLLSLNNDGTYVGSGGFGYTDELPASDFVGTVRCRDMWGFTESQETVSVSPAMYEEFVFPYEKPIMDRFGLTCYGCCEPLDSRWHVVKRHHGLRRVSCSPWCDLRKMASLAEDQYILSVKAHPGAVAGAKINGEAIRHDIRTILDQTRGCVVEIIMKDNHTIGGRPENVTEWCEIAKHESKRFSSA